MTDTSPKRLRDIAHSLRVLRCEDYANVLEELAAEKEAAGCSSFCAPSEPCLVSEDGKCLAEKEAQNHPAQHLEMVSADVPLPEPFAWRAVGGSIWLHKTRPDDTAIYDREALLQYGQSCAMASQTKLAPALLTDEEIQDLFIYCASEDDIWKTRAIEAAVLKKNWVR